MRKLNQTGSLLLPLIIVLVLFLGASGFGVWAFMSRQDYKNNSDEKSAVAAKQSATKEAAKNAAEYAEKEKSPFNTYVSSSESGNITFQYPKTWNQYSAKATSDKQLDNYFSPSFVPDISSGQPYALRLQVLNKAYITVLASYDKSVASGASSVSAYRLPKVTAVLGSIVSGPTANSKQGTTVLLPIRDKTLIIWTEGTAYTSDFTNTILPSVSFTP